MDVGEYIRMETNVDVRVYMCTRDVRQLNTISYHSFCLIPSETTFSKSQAKARCLPPAQPSRVRGCAVRTPLASLQTQVLSEKEEEEPRTLQEMLRVIKFPGGDGRSAAAGRAGGERSTEQAAGSTGSR